MHELATMAEHIALQLIARGETVAVAESSAGGLVAAALLATPGASRFFMGGAVIYTGAARAALLGITPDIMEGLQPATEPYAALLARSARQQLNTTWGIGETGAAGPTGNRYGDAAGHSCVAVFGRHELRRTIATGSADRWPNMQAFALAALTLFGEALGLG
jgi:PncC family amidohydrolase